MAFNKFLSSFLFIETTFSFLHVPGNFLLNLDSSKTSLRGTIIIVTQICMLSLDLEILLLKRQHFHLRGRNLLGHWFYTANLVKWLYH